MVAMIGVDLGERRVAICVTVPDWREGSRPHFLVRHLERLPPRTPYPATARRLKQIAAGLAAYVETVFVYVNVTVAGLPAIELIRDESEIWVQAVRFYQGHQEPAEQDSLITLGKAYLVRRLQVLLQAGRLHLPKDPEHWSLLERLPNYDTQIPPGADHAIGAFSTGSEDDLVTALGLAVHQDPPWSDIRGEQLDAFFEPDPVTSVLTRATGIRF